MIILRKYWNSLIFLIVFCLYGLLFFITGCEKVDLAEVNIVTTSKIDFISETEATGGGKIYNGGRTFVNSRGICWGTEPMPTLINSRSMNGTGEGSFSSTMTGLLPNTKYYVRAYASNTYGTSFGSDVSFTTSNSELPILTTITISDLESTTCTSGGNISYEGNGTIISRGVCWASHNQPTISDSRTQNGSGIGVFKSTISGFSSDSIYYVRAYATNSEGTAYGNQLKLIPFKSTVTDVDGNVYNSISIGTQVWTVENLKVTKYQNGEAIQNILDNSTWNNLSSGAFCDYDNNSLNRNTYGVFYNWFAASDPRNIAPKGWHVASYEEYQLLIDYLGGPAKAEENLKTAGFNVLPAGKRTEDGIYLDKGIFPYLWSSTEYHVGSNWARYLSINGADLYVNCLSKNNGFSVRCIRD